jgi:cysteine desulfurase
VLPVDSNGFVNPEDVKNAITEKTVLITIMHSNNEIGVIEPIKEIGEIAREKGITFHTDATQSVGKVPVDVADLGCDLLSLSAHKLYGPKGVGALYIRKGTRILPFMHGGAQENNRRAGTLNVPGIVGLGRATELASSTMEGEAARETAMRDRLIAGILSAIPDSRLNGDAQKRLPNNVNVSIEGIEGESMILRLDFAGFCVSSGSACTSGSLEASHVLLAIGLPHELAHGSLRISLGRSNTEADVDNFLEAFPKIVELLRAMSPVYNACPADFSAE